jgi:formiminoglutamate deiminase
VPDERALHCELAWLGGDTAAADVLITLDGDRIAAVTAGVQAPAGATRLRGLALPGFANAHSHAFHRALRGRTQAGGTFWTWREQMYRLAETLDPDGYHRLARAAYGEMALAGITCVGEFHYLHHAPDGKRYADPNAMGAALVAAAAEAGIRITLLDTCFLHGGIGAGPEGVQRRFSDGDVARWGERAAAAVDLESAMARIGAAVHSVRAVDPAGVAVVADWAAAHGTQVHAHVSEQPAENEECLARFGRSPTGVLAEADLLSERFTAVHATHVTDDDVRLLGEAAATACLCPTTERDLADGIGPAARLAAAGASLSLGTDSHALIDPFEEMRAVEMDERLASHRRGTLAAPELLRAATEDGHRGLGWADAGALRPGALADVVTVRLDTVRTAGTDRAHTLDVAVFAAGAADVADVVVGGRRIVAGGAHRTLDVVAELDATVRGSDAGDP